MKPIIPLILIIKIKIMKRQKDYTIETILFCLLLAVLGSMVSCSKLIKVPVSVEYFKQGQILFPDYACPDTLIVRDAVGLNKAMAYVEQDIDWGSDADCDSLIHVYCDYANSK